jgi:hypothetical protein
MAQIPGRKEQAIPLPDGGYFASTTVYHNLHCIVSSRSLTSTTDAMAKTFFNGK